MSSAAAVQNPSELDDFLLALALEVAALEDAEASPETVLRGKGKGPASGLDDFLLAARLQALEEKQLLEDSKMARSIAGACVADSEVIEALIQQERAEERDRRLALAIGGGRESPIGARPSSRSSVTSVASSAPSFELPPFPVRAGQSSGSSTPASAGSSLYGECASCFSTKLVLALPCKDRYCAACIIGLVKTAAKDVTLIPARCCGKPFPESLIASVLRTDPTTLRDYEKMKAHKSEMIAASEKAVDEDTGASFERSGLKRCPGCRHFIEKVFGCNHMTCALCRHEFCWLCASRWHTCRCPLYNETEIDAIIQARHIPEPQREQVRVAMHDFEHRHAWRFTRGNARCAYCNWFTDQFYFECAGCREAVCKRCKMNRM